MQSEQPLQPVKNEERSISILPFDVQLQNIFALEVAAKRFPIELSQTQLSPIEGYTCKINPGGLSSPDCTNLTALYKQAQELDFKAHIGAICFETSRVITQRINRIPLDAAIYAYGTDNIRALEKNPF